MCSSSIPCTTSHLGHLPTLLKTRFSTKKKPQNQKEKNALTPPPLSQQNEYSHGLLAISSLPSSRTTIHNVLQKYRKAGGDIIHIRHVTPLGAPLFTPRTELAEEFEELVEGMGEKERVIEKQHPSAFTGTDLERAMEGFGKKKIVLGGELLILSLCASFSRGEERESVCVCLLADTVVGYMVISHPSIRHC